MGVAKYLAEWKDRDSATFNAWSRNLELIREAVINRRVNAMKNGRGQRNETLRGVSKTTGIKIKTLTFWPLIYFRRYFRRRLDNFLIF